jgi:dihydropteroate synthase
MGVVNVTDDSFSDGGLFLDRDRAVEHAMALAADGAAIIAVGGESTRPGATRIDGSVESARVLPVIKELAGQGLTVSIDTMHADVAAAALENGAQIVNDVSGGRADPDMARVVAHAGVPWVLMHCKAPSRGAAVRGRGGAGAHRAALGGRRRGEGGRGRGQPDHRSRTRVRKER